MRRRLVHVAKDASCSTEARLGLRRRNSARSRRESAGDRNPSTGRWLISPKATICGSGFITGRPGGLGPVQCTEAPREGCRPCYLGDVDGGYELPLKAQFRPLAGLGDQMGQALLTQGAKMNPLPDAATHAVLGHGFEPVKAERF